MSRLNHRPNTFYRCGGTDTRPKSKNFNKWNYPCLWQSSRHVCINRIRLQRLLWRSLHLCRGMRQCFCRWTIAVLGISRQLSWWCHWRCRRSSRRQSDNFVVVRQTYVHHWNTSTLVLCTKLCRWRPPHSIITDVWWLELWLAWCPKFSSSTYYKISGHKTHPACKNLSCNHDKAPTHTHTHPFNGPFSGTTQSEPVPER